MDVEIDSETLALRAIDKVISSARHINHVEYVDCMKAAGQHVDTMQTERRMRLRKYILDKGVRPHSPNTNPMDFSFDINKYEEPGVNAISIDKVGPYICAWPIGLPSERLCCGESFTAEEVEGVSSTMQRYCRMHRKSAGDKESTKRPASPNVLPRAKAVNFALRNRKGNSFGWRNM